MSEIIELKEKLAKLRESNRNLNYENGLLEIQIKKIDAQIEATENKINPQKEKISYESKVESARLDLSIEGAAEKRNEDKKALLAEIEKIQKENESLENDIALLKCKYKRVATM